MAGIAQDHALEIEGQMNEITLLLNAVRVIAR